MELTNAGYNWYFEDDTHIQYSVNIFFRNITFLLNYVEYFRNFPRTFIYYYMCILR